MIDFDSIDVMYAENKFGKYAIPTDAKEKKPVIEAMKGEVHEEKTINYLLNNARNGAIVHAGAFYGDFLPALGSLGNKIFTFEPVLRYYLCAKKTIELNFPNGNHNIELFNYGLSDSSSTKNILHTTNKGVGMGGSAMYDYDKPENFALVKRFHDPKRVPTENQIEETKVVTLDSIIPEQWHSNVSIIHLDIELHEEAALRGATDIIEKSKPTIIVEDWGVLPEWKDRTFLNNNFFLTYLKQFGYTHSGNLGRNLILRTIKR